MLTREVIVLRLAETAPCHFFSLYGRLRSKVVRRQWDRVIFMQRRIGRMSDAFIVRSSFQLPPTCACRGERRLEGLS